MEKNTLYVLARMIEERRQSSAEKSYTKSLLEKGTRKCAKKFGEEAVETVIAAVDESDEELKGEIADTLYHLMVLMASRGLELNDVLEELESRMGISGHDEKASRS